MSRRRVVAQALSPKTLNARRRELLSILGDAVAAHPQLAQHPAVQQPLAALLADPDGEVRALVLQRWHGLLPKAVPERMQVRLVVLGFGAVTRPPRTL